MYSIKFPLDEETRIKLEEIIEQDPFNRGNLLVKLQNQESKEKLSKYLDDLRIKYSFILQIAGVTSIIFP